MSRDIFSRCVKLLVAACAVWAAAPSIVHAQSYYIMGVTRSGMMVLDRDSIRWREGSPQATVIYIAAPNAVRGRFSQQEKILRNMTVKVTVQGRYERH